MVSVCVQAFPTGDELVLEAALATGSNWIVTHNIRHLTAGAGGYRIETIRPGEALRRLGGATMSAFMVGLPVELKAEVARRAGGVAHPPRAAG